MTARVSSTMVIAIPSSELVKGWQAPPIVCGDGVIVLFAQGDPPHPTTVECHRSPRPRTDGSFSGQPEDVSRFPSQARSRRTLDGTAGAPAIGGPSIKRYSNTPCRFGSEGERDGAELGIPPLDGHLV